MWEKIKENKDFQNENLKDFWKIENELIDILFENNWGSVMETDEILEFLENSPELKNKKFLKFSYSSNKIFFETVDNSWKKEKLIFNLETKKFEKEIEKKLSETPKLLENSSNILSAMDDIFQRNENDEFFWEINEKDVLKTDLYDKNSLKLKWKNLRELQIIFRENQKKLDSIQSSFSPEEKKDFIRQQKKYLEIFSWIGDKYEWWAAYLLETETNFQKIAENIIKNSSITEVLLYMAELHQKIDWNNFQSKTVEKTYKMTMDLFSEWLFQRLKKENAPDSDFVNFSKILTWRGDYKNWKFEDKDIDEELRNPALATEALNFVFTRKWWMFEKMWIKNLDDSLKNKNISDVNKELELELKHIFWQEIKAENFYSSPVFSWFMWDWFWSLNQFKWKKYEDMDFQNQTKLWVINKIIISLKTKRINKIKISENPNDKNSLNSIMQDIAETYMKQSEKNIEKIFSSDNPFSKSFWKTKTAKDFWLTWIQKEAYDLFVNMNWVWLATLSDSTTYGLKFIWKIGAVVWVSIWAAILTGWTSLVVQWAVAWAAWSASAWWVFWKWYDTKKEALVDTTTDLALWTATWALSWAVSAVAIWAKSWFFKEWVKKWISNVKKMEKWKDVIVNWTVIPKKDITLKSSLFLNAVDFWIWWVTEFFRDKKITEIFHNQNSIVNSKDDDLEKIYKNQNKSKNQTKIPLKTAENIKKVA